MKPILKYTLIGLLVVAVAGSHSVGVAYAQGDVPTVGRLAELLGLTTKNSGTAAGWKNHPGAGRGSRS